VVRAEPACNRLFPIRRVDRGAGSRLGGGQAHIAQNAQAPPVAHRKVRLLERPRGAVQIVERADQQLGAAGGR
jgi:hypothetical protein